MLLARFVRHLALMIAVFVAAALMPRPVGAEDAAPPASYRGDMMTWIKDAQDKLEQLAGAMPESKYSWRPGKGVRSVGEVYMHVAAANFGLPGMMGVAPPEGFKFDTFEQSLTRKEDIRKALHDSFEHMEKAFANVSEADLDKKVDFFGNPMTERSAYVLLLSHAHEHLGQSIAYARSNGVVPPWTAKQQAAAQEQQEKMKSGKK